MKPLQILIPIIFFSTLVFAGKSWSLPKRTMVLPVNYLKMIKVQNPNKKLTSLERKELIRLFENANNTNHRKYQQDYLIETNTPIYILLKKNFPVVSSQEGEGGVFIGNIVKILSKKH